jgi:hypothetical protein
LRKELEPLRKETEPLRKETEPLRKETESLKKELKPLKNDLEPPREETESLRKETETTLSESSMMFQSMYGKEWLRPSDYAREIGELNLLGEEKATEVKAYDINLTEKFEKNIEKYSRMKDVTEKWVQVLKKALSYLHSQKAASDVPRTSPRNSSRKSGSGNSSPASSTSSSTSSTYAFSNPGRTVDHSARHHAQVPQDRTALQAHPRGVPLPQEGNHPPHSLRQGTPRLR